MIINLPKQRARQLIFVGILGTTIEKNMYSLFWCTVHYVYLLSIWNIRHVLSRYIMLTVFGKWKMETATRNFYIRYRTFPIRSQTYMAAKKFHSFHFVDKCNFWIHNLSEIYLNSWSTYIVFYSHFYNEATTYLHIL